MYPFPDLKNRLDNGRTYISHRKERDPISKLSHGIRRLENRVFRYDVEQRQLASEFDDEGNIRKKLHFTDDEEDGLDFTDKIAAFRSILKRPIRNDIEDQNGNAEFISPRPIGVDAKNDAKRKKKIQDLRNEEKIKEKLVDEELARMSYQNYEAMQHLEKYSGLLTKVGDKVNSVSDKMKVKTDSSFKPKLVQDNMDFVLGGKDNHKTSANSKFQDLDKVPERDKATTCIYIHNYEAVPKCQNCQSSLSCRSCPDHIHCQNCVRDSSLSSRQGNLTCPKCNAPLLENGIGFGSSQKGSKFIQSNVPHFDPILESSSREHNGKLSDERRKNGGKSDKNSSHVIQSNLKQRTSRKQDVKSHKSKRSSELDAGALTLDDLKDPPKNEKQRYNRREKSKSRYSSEDRKKSKVRKKLEDDFDFSDSSLKENIPNGKKIKNNISSQKSKMTDSEEKRLKSKVAELFGIPNGIIDLKIPEHLQNSGQGVMEEIQRNKALLQTQIPNGHHPSSDGEARYVFMSYIHVKTTILHFYVMVYFIRLIALAIKF